MAAQPRASRGFTLIEVLVAISVMALMSLMAWRGLDGMLRTQSSLQNRSDEIRTLQAGLAQWQTDLDQLAELPGTPSFDWNGQVLRLTRRSAPAPLVGNLPSQAPSVRVVAWTWRSDPGRPGGGDWQRWQSAPLSQQQDWQNAWALAQQWGQTPTSNTRAGQIQIYALAGWQLFVHRGGSWTNPLSSDALTPGSPGSPSTPGSPGSPADPASGSDNLNMRSNLAAANAANASNAATAATAPVTAVTPDAVRLVLSLPPGPAGSGTLTLDWVRPTLSGTAS